MTARRLVSWVGLALLLAWGLPGAASAGMLTLDINTAFANQPALPGGSHVVFTFYDGADAVTHGAQAGDVALVMTAVNFVGTENAYQTYFNYGPNGANAPSSNPLTITNIGGLAPQSGGISTGINAFKADGDGYYDVQIDFSSGTTGLGATNTTSTFDIHDSTTANLLVSMFDFPSWQASPPPPGDSPYFAAAHFQNIGPGGSTWAGALAPGNNPNPGGGGGAVPEPASLLLMGLGLGGVALYRRFKW